MVVSSGGVDILLPEPWEPTAHTVGAVTGIGASLANTGLALAGNKLIQYAWANPGVHPPDGSLVGGGNSRMFQSHHIYPRRQLGTLPLPNNLLDDSVILPTGVRGGFIPNLHTATGGYHPSLLQTAIRESFADMNPAEKLAFFQEFNNGFMNGLLTNVKGQLINWGVWGGLQVKNIVRSH